MNSELGDLKTQSKKQIEKMELIFQDNIFQNRKFKLKFFPWIRTGQLKKILIKQKFNDKHKHLHENDVRLFCKNIEITQENKNFFDFYKIESGSTVIIMKNANSHNLENGIINPYQIFEQTPQQITQLIINVQSGLNAARKPRLASEGTSGTYFLENNQKKIVAVYKPYDQEPYTPNNPRGYVGQLGSQGIRKGILSGQCATREVAAYLLDSVHHFHQVPATTYIEFYHPCFRYTQVCQSNPILSNKECDLNKQKTKHGSLQQFVEYFDVVGNLGSHQFDVNQVHKIAILDIRILNCDRNQANILVVKKMITNNKGVTTKVTNLIPIDHGLSFPDNFQIYDHQIVWMTYKQTQMPLSQKSLQFIENIDPAKDCQTLRQKLGFRQICLRNFRIAQIFLKKMAKAGFTLYEIGSFLYRVQDSDCYSSQDDNQVKSKDKKPVLSQFQKLVKQAQVIYFTVSDNGMKSTIQIQIGIIKQRRNEQQVNGYDKIQKIVSKQQKIQHSLNTKDSLPKKQTSIQKIKVRSISTGRDKLRNVSLPHLKTKASRDFKDRRLHFKKNKTKQKPEEAKQKYEKWGDIFYHYFEQILDRFIKKKLQVRKKPTQPSRGRIFSESIEL